MELDGIIKVSTLVIGAIGVAKIFYEISIGKRLRMREEYRFAKEFLGELEVNKALHPLAKEKGFKAIAGDDEISSQEIEYLLSLEQPHQAINDYVLGRQYLQHLPNIGNQEILFKKWYRYLWLRRALKALFSILYASLVFLAFAPVLFPKYLFKDPSKVSAAAIIMCFAVFSPYAWFALKALKRIVRAEKLVKRQQKHTPAVFLSVSNRNSL